MYIASAAESELEREERCGIILHIEQSFQNYLQQYYKTYMYTETIEFCNGKSFRIQ